jgi:post-segregation antitoxin (ccd killing protein)
MNLTVPEELADAARALGVNASQAAWLGRHGMPLEPTLAA